MFVVLWQALFARAPDSDSGAVFVPVNAIRVTGRRESPAADFDRPFATGAIFETANFVGKAPRTRTPVLHRARRTSPRPTRPSSPGRYLPTAREGLRSAANADGKQGRRSLCPPLAVLYRFEGALIKRCPVVDSGLRLSDIEDVMTIRAKPVHNFLVDILVRDDLHVRT